MALTSARAQVKIGDNPQNINPTSLLELESTSSALVITRVSEAQMTGMAPLRGALVYNTDEECVFYYNGNEWFNLCEDEGSVNVSLEVINDELVLTDSSDNAVSIPLEDLNTLTFTTDAIVNPTQPIVRDSTIVITQNGTNYNFEVGEITGDNIVDSSINGFSDIQDASITANKLSDNVAGVGLSQAVNGSLNVDLSQITGTGTLSSSGTIAIIGQPMNALFNDIAIDVADNGITSAKILDGQVQTDDIADNAVSTAKILDDNVTVDKINSGTANQVLRTNAAGTDVEWGVIDANSITGQDLTATDGSITVATGTGATLVASSISVTNDGITNAKIADDAVQVENILNGTANQVLRTNAAGTDVEWGVIDANSITGQDLTATDGSITVATGTGATLVASSISVTNDGITNAKIADDAVQVENILNGTANQVLRTNAAGTDVEWGVIDTNSITGQDLTATDGSITVATGTGATLVASSISVTNDGITNAKIADDAVQVENILNGTANQVLRTNAAGTDVEWGVIDANSITGQDLTATDGSITVATGTGATLVASSISVTNDGITNAKIADDAVQVENILNGTANQVLRTNAAGTDVEWGVIDANSITGQDLTATDGSITVATGTGATLVASSISVTNDGITNAKIADDAVQVENILNGTANQVLRTNAAGTDVEWGVIDANSITGQDLTATDGSITVATGTGATLVASSISVTNDGITNAKIADDAVQLENIANGTTDGNIIQWSGTTSEWVETAVPSAFVTGSTAGSVFFADATGNLTENNAQFFWDQTGNRLGIGTNTPAVGTKLHVANGNTRTEGILNSAGTLLNPAYGFSGDTDTNTGMYFPAQDQLGLVVGALEAINVREIGNATETTINGSLELTEQLFDETAAAGNAGDVLTATATGTEWREPAVVAMGKANGANSISVNGATVGGAGGGVNTVTLNTARPDGDYIIQLSVAGDNRIFVTSQNAGDFTVEIRDNATDALVIANWYFTVLDF
ncbi:hypothetical protein FGF1_06490 [Flavobacteriaceae bacterium GF1]